jgi:acyl-CoA thioester hydrolase
MIEALQDYPVVVKQDVRWGDMDAFQHVNNTVYFRYFESARIAFFEKVGFVRTEGGDTDIGPILAETSCRFRRPLTYPDTLHIGVQVTEMANDRMTMKYVVWSTKLNCVAAEGAGTIVAYDYQYNPKAALPRPVRQAIEALRS